MRFTPDGYAAYYNLGVIAVLEEQWPEAEAQLKTALKVEPESPMAHNTLGSLYVKRKDLELARRELV